jgi:dipeptidyl aminopeptidase/acylaminoacyl peptidase
MRGAAFAPVLFVPIAAAVTATATCLEAQGPRAARPMELKDWYRVTSLSQPAMSPDGKRVAVTVTTVREGENKRHQEVWVVPVDGGAPQRWTSPGTESSAPRWSPDGRWLLFASTRTGGELRGPGTAWALRADAPGGEAIQTRAYPAASVSAAGTLAVWSEALPADTASPRNDPYARMGAMSRPPFDAITRPTDAARYDGRHVVDMAYKSNERGFVPGRRTARAWRPS